MAMRVESVVIDAADPQAMAAWWAELLGWTVKPGGDDDEVAILAPDPATSGLRAMLFLRVPEAKAGKNRLHIDLHPEDQDAEVARAESLGARRVDIGQGEQPWIVLADPEGNEFCLLRSRVDPL